MEHSAILRTSAPRVEQRSRFYVWIALTYLVIAAIGFGQTYGVPVIQGSQRFNPAVHVHGWLQFSWLLFFVLQSWLASSGQVRRHRDLGLMGISLATLLVVTAIPAAVNRGNIILTSGGSLPVVQQFVGSVVIDAAVFAILVAAAIVFLKNPGVHRRLLTAATLVNVGAAFNRLYKLYAPSVAADFNKLHHIEIPILTGDLLMIPILIHDWRLERRIHPANVIALGALLVLHIARVPLGASVFSQAIGAYIYSFVGK